MHIWGFYTLSAAIIYKQELSGSDEKKIVKHYQGYPVPAVRIGFMGRDVTVEKDFGSILLIDAARRVHRNSDIAALAIVLESEGGRTKFQALGMVRTSRLQSMSTPDKSERRRSRPHASRYIAP